MTKLKTFFKVLEAWCHIDFRKMEVNKFGRTSLTETQAAQALFERRYPFFNLYAKVQLVKRDSRGGSRISKGGVDGRPYLLRGGRENALTKKIGNNFSCTCLRRVF